MTLPRLSLRAVTLGVMAIAVVFSATLGYVLYRGGQTRAQTNNEVNLQIAQIARYEDAQIAFGQLGSDLTTYYVIRADSYPAAFELARARVNTALSDARAAAPALHADETAQADALIATFAGGDAEARIMRAVQADDVGAALAITADSGLIERSTKLTLDIQAAITAGRDDLSRLQAADSAEQKRWIAYSLAIAATWAVLLLLLGLASFRWLVQPIERVSVSTLRIADGDLTARVPEQGPRELAQVGVDVNRMRRSLVERSEELNEYLARNLETRTSELEGANAALISSEARFRVLVQNASDMVTIVDAEGYPIYASPSVRRILGYALEDWIGISLMMMVHEDDRARAAQSFAKVLATPGLNPAIELRLQHKDGGYRYVELTATNLIDDPDVRGIVHNARDVTARHAAEVSLIESEARFRAIAENSAVGIYQLSSMREILYLNRAALEIMEADDLATAQSVRFDRFFPPESIATMDREHEKRALGLASSYEVDLIGLKGSRRTLYVSAAPVADADGEARSVVGTLMDVTDRNRVAKELAESEGRFRALVQNGTDMVTIIDAEGFVQYASPSVERILGYREEDWVNVLTVVHPDDLARAVESGTEVVATPGGHAAVELRLRRRDGEYRYVELIASNLLNDPSIRGIVHNSRDVTVQHDIEAALRESEGRFRSLAEHSPVGIYQLSPGGKVLYLNPAALAILEADALTTVQEVPFEQFFTARGHSYLPWAMRVHDQLPAPADGAQSDALSGSRGVASTDEVEAIGLKGAHRNLLVSGAPVADGHGKVYSLVGTMIDITARKEVEGELRENEEKFRLLFASNPHPMWVYDRETLRFLEVNATAMANYGYTRAQFLEMRITDIRPEEDNERLSRAVQRSAPLVQAGEWRHRTKDGRIIDVEITSHSFRFEDRDAVLVVALDITERKRVAQALAESEERFRSLVQHASDLITVIRADTTVIYQSPSIRGVLGFGAPELVGRRLSEIMHPEDIPHLVAFLSQATAQPAVAVTFEARLRHRDGTWQTFEIVGSDHTADAAVGGFVLNTRDVSERKELEHQLRDQAFKDGLTGLANRARFMDRLEHALERTVRGSAAVAVLFVDLDNFKSVNDSLGHAAGDAVLIEVAERVHGCVRAGDTVARFGGDEFAVLMEDAGTTTDATSLAARLIEELAKPYELPSGKSVTIGASVGVAFANPDDLTRDLVQDADLAMYIAKTHGKSRYEVYDAEMHAAMANRLELVADLQRALEAPDLFIEYQPTFRLASGEFVGVEALVRWQHPRRGRIMPTEFISLAEESGLIVPIGRWVLASACREAERWEASYPDQFVSMAVNVSVRQLQQPHFVREVAEVLEESGVDPARIVLEVTESVLMQDVDATIPVLDSLKELGVRLAIDDFGTGYSSLSYLARFPFDILKIDKSFIDGIDSPGQQLELTRAIIELAKVLGLEVVAEGVEREEQAAQLRTLRCDLVQGFLFARPLPAAHIVGMLDRVSETRAA